MLSLSTPLSFQISAVFFPPPVSQSLPLSSASNGALAFFLPTKALCINTGSDLAIAGCFRTFNQGSWVPPLLTTTTSLQAARNGLKMNKVVNLWSFLRATTLKHLHHWLLPIHTFFAQKIHPINSFHHHPIHCYTNMRSRLFWQHITPQCTPSVGQLNAIDNLDLFFKCCFLHQMRRDCTSIEKEAQTRILIPISIVIIDRPED